MKRTHPLLYTLALTLLLPACVATETGNPPFTVEDESWVVQQVAPPAPGDPTTTSITAPAGSVVPASGQVEVRLLDTDAPTEASPVQADGSFSITFDQQGDERFRVLVRDGSDASAPIDARAGFDGLTQLTRTECVVIAPVVGIETTRVVVQNECTFPVTRGASSLRRPSGATVTDGPLEVGAGDEIEITVTGLTEDNTLLVPLLPPVDELRAVTFLAE